MSPRGTRRGEADGTLGTPRAAGPLPPPLAGRPTRAQLCLPAAELAPRLLGCRLVRVLDRGPDAGARLVGRIVETEAYLPAGDGASHSAPGPTARNATMFAPGGHLYVYLSYGVHHCVNVVSGPEGSGEAVLLRALEPLAGGEVLARRRGRPAARDWCSGPGKLARALDLDLAHDGLDLLSNEGPAGALRLLAPERGWTRPDVRVGPRVGITKDADLPLRFALAGPWASRG